MSLNQLRQPAVGSGPKGELLMAKAAAKEVRILTGSADPLEVLLAKYVEEFVSGNQAARVVANGLRVIGIGFRPVVDHLTFRTLHVEDRAREFLAYGYEYDQKLGVLEYENWWAKVYRKSGYPVIFIDQAFEGKRGKASLIPEWVAAFGDKGLHHIAVRVDEIESAVYFLEKQGVAFTGKIAGDKGSDLRQIFSVPQMRDGKVFSVLELSERHRGYAGFLPPQADVLMQSTKLSSRHKI